MFEIRTSLDLDAIDQAGAVLFVERPAFHVLDLLHLLQDVLALARRG